MHKQADDDRARPPDHRAKPPRWWPWLACHLIVILAWGVMRFRFRMDGAADVGAILVGMALLGMRMAPPPEPPARGP